MLLTHVVHKYHKFCTLYHFRKYLKLKAKWTGKQAVSQCKVAPGYEIDTAATYSDEYSNRFILRDNTKCTWSTIITSKSISSRHTKNLKMNFLTPETQPVPPNTNQEGPWNALRHVKMLGLDDMSYAEHTPQLHPGQELRVRLQ